MWKEAAVMEFQGLRKIKEKSVNHNNQQHRKNTNPESQD
jgi:hypothetical protein